MRLTSTKTLPVLIKALKTEAFTQTELAKESQVSIGRVNKIIKWLQEKEIVVKEKGKYSILRPNYLTEIIASQQSILKKHTYHVAADKKKILSQGKPCLISAAEKLLKKELDDTAHLVADENTNELLNSLPRGSTVVQTYECPSQDSLDPIHTIINLKSVGRLTEAEMLAETAWRTRQ